MNNVTSEILFEKFEVIECFKKDEHASVYLANHIYLGKKIILKALNTKTIFDEAKVERFKREAKIMAKLDHPNIIKVLDFGTYNEFFYISFEYFESNNLRSYIKDKSLSLEQKKNLVIQLFHGLGYAHQNQIIHRDIKPENILVNDNSELKIGDFGLALALNDNFVTSQYAIVGTPCYMSPEQVQGGRLTSQSDLFSAGIVALELFSDKNPFLGDDVNKTISNLINYNEDTVEAYLISLPEELQSIIRKLLSKRPDRRYKTAEAVLKDLDVPLSSIKISPFAFLKKQRYWVAATIVIILITASVALSLFNKEQLPETNLASDTPAQIEKSEGDNSTPPEQISDSNSEETPVTNPDEQNEPGNELIAANEEAAGNNVTKNVETTPAVTFGSLYVECVPWAHIYLDDRRLETTPISEPIDLRTGTYTIKLIHPDYPEYTTDVEIKPDEKTDLFINLDTLYGFLLCNVFPWADIYLNDEFLGQTPFGEPVKLVPGTHLLSIKNPNYPEVVERINITRKDTLVLSYNLNEVSKNKLGSTK